MASRRPSMRSRANHAALANGTSAHHHHHAETEFLIDELRSFRLERFDADRFVESRCQTMSEKGIRSLCAELIRIKKASAEEICQSVYANYGAFIRTSQELSDLEGELLTMRNLLSKQAALVNGLVDGVRQDFFPSSRDLASEGVPYCEDYQTLLEDSQVLPDTLDVLIAERRVDEAIAVLLEGEKVAMDTGKEHAGHASMTRLQALLSERKSRLAEQLMEVVQQPSTCGREVRAAVVGLYRLGDGPRAHTLLLNAHSQKLHYKVQGLRSSTPCYGEAYTSTLSQLVFSALSQAAKDSQSVFGDQAAYMSELVLWASIEVKNFAALVERHVLLPATATGGLHAAAECVQIALGYCSLLENQGLALCPDLLKLVRPNIEKTLQANMRHIKESVADLVSVDDWIVSLSSGSTGSHISGGLMMQMKLSSSAQRFQMLVQEFFDDVVPLINMQLGGPLLDNCAYLFEYYVSFLIKALPYPDNESLETHMDTRTIMLAEMDHQQLGLLANASALAEEILPRAAAKILPLQQINGIEEARKQAQNTASLRVTELREWRRRLQRTADTLRERYCWKQVIDLIFKDGGANFSVDSYIVLDNDGDNLEPMPTALFQDLLFKLNKLSYVAADVLAGRERVTLSILSRVVETFVIFILEDEAFWEGTEEGSKPLGQAGLQQFVLDMHFVIQIASHGRYITRKIGAVVLDIITRAAATFSTAELDPYSFVPEEWFLNAAQDCMHRLLGD